KYPFEQFLSSVTSRRTASNSPGGRCFLAFPILPPWFQHVYAQQNHGGECCSIDRSAKLAIPIMVAKTDGAINQLCQSGKSVDVLKPGGRMGKAKKHLPPGELLAVRLEVTEERNCSNGYFRKGNSLMMQYNKLLIDGIAFTADTGKEQEKTVISNFIAQQISVHATNANSNACRTAVGMLFRIQGFQEERINGFALKQITKKPLAATRKKKKKEPIYKLDILLKHIQERAVIKQRLNEQEHLGCTIFSTIAFFTLRLAEIYRASVVKMEDNVWQLNTSIQKGDNYDLTVTLRPLSNAKVCPTEWLQSWIALRKKNDLDKSLWWGAKNMKASSYEYLSKAVHLVTNAAGVHKGNSVTSIKNSSITKSINQGATIQEINRASRHKDGPSKKKLKQ
ncbi:MAG: hypothetical protein EZS28_041297, partial [Streblomastix strix]